jgi:hypothetical protein
MIFPAYLASKEFDYLQFLLMVIQNKKARY